jgi:polyribonucleotide 5'-hydroxyl-kinase
MNVSSAVTKREWVLAAETELRCEVAESEVLTIRLLDGSAEIFGIEVPLQKEVTLSDESIAVFTWYGCTIETVCTGPNSVVDVYDNTPMATYANVHIQLEAMRDVAAINGEHGPNVLVVGPNDSGKSSVARIIASYATRLDRAPIYVDLDVSQGSSTLPGCISSVVLDKSVINAEDGFVMGSPLVYYFGHTSAKSNPDLYKLMCSNLAQKVKSRQQNDNNCRSSGVIINTSGWIDGAGVDVINYFITEFNVGVVLVMNHDRLYSTLAKSYAEGVTVVKMPRSGGCVTRVSYFSSS